MTIPDLKEKLNLAMAERMGALLDDTCETEEDIKNWLMQTEQSLYDVLREYANRNQV